jgi:hypothetical protein
MPTEKHGAKGEMYLDYYWKESASSHRDQYRIKKLVGSEENVELEIEEGDNVASKGTSETGGHRYSIPVNTLIKLIKEHGKQLPRRKPKE